MPPDFEGTSVLYRKVAALAAGLSASVPVLGSGVASADESTYVQLLDAGNVPYDTPAGAVLMGTRQSAPRWKAAAASDIQLGPK
jgi:hypothetical protein